MHNKHIISNYAFYRPLEFARGFCDSLHITMHKNSKGEDSKGKRIPIEQSDTAVVQYQCSNVWMPHVVATFGCKTIDEAVTLEFKLHCYSSSPNDMLTKNWMRNKSKPITATVKILPKPLPFR